MLPELKFLPVDDEFPTFETAQPFASELRCADRFTALEHSRIVNRKRLALR